MRNKKQTNPAVKSQYSRLTRVMAAFTASLFLVSSQLALPAQANNLGRGDMSRQEWRQHRQDIRNASNPGVILMPVVPTPAPGTVPVHFSEPICPPPILEPSVNFFGNDPVKPGQVPSITRRGGGRDGERGGNGRGRSAEGIRHTTPAAAQSANSARGAGREDRDARIQARKDAKLSSFVTQLNDGQLIKLDNGANLDLTASARNITIGDRLLADGASVTIKVGGETKTVNAGSQVTAAEYVAVKQVLADGKQDVTINASGIATGGTVDLGQVSAQRNNMKSEGLTVGEGVTAVGNLSKNSNFRLNGDLNNFGTVVATADSKGRHAGEISAVNITNNEGATISADAGNKFGNKADAIDLTLSADEKFKNFGSIIGSGDLNINAGESITNTGSISTTDNISLNSASTSNSGVVASYRGDITVDSPAGTELNVNNAGGTFNAANGAINIRDAANVTAGNTNFTGGDLISRDVNIQAGQAGMVELHVNKLTGTLNGSGWGTHVSANTDVLNIGDICLTGDPTFKNATGNINLTGNLSATEAIAILASGDITATGGANITITAQNGTGVGQLVTMAAGYGITGTGVDNLNLPGGTAATGAITIDSTTGTGGSINLSNAASFNIVVNGTGAGDNGGNVNMYANQVLGVGGNILLPTNSAINTFSGGTLGGANSGNVNIIAAGNIAVGSIDALDTTTASGQGNVLIRNVNPTGTATFATTGAQTASTIATAGPATSGTISFNAGSNIEARGNVTVDSFGSLTANGGSTINSQNGTLSVTTTSLGSQVTTSGASINWGAAGNVNLTTSAINTTGAGAGGAVTILADNNDNGSGNLNGTGVVINTSGTAGGAGGAITLDSGEDVGQVLNIGALTSAGDGAGAGGNINIGTVNASAGTITIGGAVNAGTGAFTVDGDDNDHDLTLGGNVNTSAFNVDLDTGNIIGPAGGITITTNGYTVTAGTFTAGGNPITIQEQTAGTTIGLAGGAGTLNISGGELADFVTSSLQIGSAGQGAGTVTTGGAINLGTLGYNLGVFTGGDYAGGANNITLGGQTVTIDAAGSITSGNFTGGTGTAAVLLNSDTSSVSVGTITNQTGSINIDAATSASVGAISTTDGIVDIDAVAGAVTVASIAKTGANDISIDAGTDVTVTGATSSTGGGNVTYTAVTGLINTGAITTTTGNITLTTIPTGTSVTTGALQTNGGNVDIDSGTTTTVASINAVNGGTITVDAGTDINLTGAVTGSAATIALNTAAGGNIDTLAITTAGPIQIGTSGNTASIDVLGAMDAGTGSITLAATGAINTLGMITVGGTVSAIGGSVFYTTISGPAGDVTLTSNTTSVTGGAITSTGLVDISGNTLVSVGAIAAGAAGVDVDALGTSASTGSITTTGPVAVTAQTSVTTGDITGPATTVDIDATTGFVNIGNVTATGQVDVTAATSLTALNINATTANINLTATGTFVNVGNLQTSGAVAITSGTDTTTLDIGTNVTPVASLLINAGGSISTGNVFVAGLIDLNAINITTLAVTAGAIDFDATNNINTGSLTATAGDVDLTATTGSTTVTGNISATDDIFITSGQNTTVTGSVTGDLVTINSGGTTTVGGPTNTTDDVIIDSDGDINIGQTTTTADIFLYSGANINVLGTLTADPIVMTALANVNLGASVNADDGITIVAGQDVTNTVGGITINGNGIVGAAGNIVVVSGADFSVVPATSVTINGASGTGGSVLFTTGAGVNVTANGAAGGAGGDVTIAAFSNGFSGGQVLFPLSTSITSTGNGAGFSGDIQVTAGAVTGTAMQLGSITTSSATNGVGGSVLLQSSTPSSGSVIANDASYSGSFAGIGSNVADIRTANITARGATVQIQGGQNVGVGTVNVSGVGTGNGGSITITAQGTDQFDIGSIVGNNFAAGLIANGGTTSGDGGNISVQNIGSTGIRSVPLSITVTDGDGGNVNLDGDTGNIQLSAGSYSVNGAGASGDGGTYTINGSGITVTGGSAAINALASGTGLGGQINLTGNGTTALTLGTGTNQVDVNVSGTGSSVNVSMGGNLTVSSTGGFTADTVNLATTGTGSDITFSAGGNVTGINTNINSADAVVVNSTVTGSTTNTVVANGNINGTGSLNGTTVDLTSVGGNIGNNAFSRLNIDATDLIANAFNGSVFLNDVNSVNVSGASSAANTFDLQSNGPLSNSAAGTIGADVVALRSTASTVALGGAVTGATSASVRAATGMTTTGAGIVQGNNVSLTADANDIGTNAGSRFQVDANNLTANATGAGGDAFINDANAVTIAGANNIAGEYNLTAGSDISSTGTLTAGTNVVLNAGGSFGLGGTIIGNTSISLTSVGSITNTNLTGTLTTPQLNLTSTGGTIGSSAASRLNVDAVNLTANASNVWIFDANDVTITGANVATGAYDVVAGNNLNTAVASTINAANVSLRATAGALGVAGNVTGTTSASLRSGQSILAANVTGTVTAPQINLTSDNGNIGASTAARFVINATNLTANAANGSVFIQDTTGGLNLGGGSSSALNTFDVLVTGAGNDLTTSGTISANNVVLAAADLVTVGASVTGTTSITVQAGGDILTANIGTNLTAPQITLIAGDDIGTSAAVRLDINATNLTLQANDDVFVNDTAGGVTLTGANTAGDIFNVQTTGGDLNVAGTITNGGALTLIALGAGSDISTTGVIAAGDTATLTANGAGANITIGANFTAGDAITMSANNNITQANGATVVNNDDITLTATNGSIGTSAASRFVVDAINVQLAAGGNAFISDLDGIILDDLTADTAVGGTLDVESQAGGVTVAAGNAVTANEVVFTSNGGGITTNAGGTVTAGAGNSVTFTSNGGNITTGAAVTATGGTVNFTTTAAGTDIATNATVTSGVVNMTSADTLDINAVVTGTTSVNLTANGNIAAGDLGGAANIVSPQVNLTSVTGSIGLTAGTRLQIAATNLTANAANDVFINDTAGGANLGIGNSSAGDEFNVTVSAGADLTTSGDITAVTISLGSAAADDVVINGNLFGTNITLTAGDDVTSNAIVSATNNVTYNAGGTINNNGATLAGNNIVFDANDDVNVGATGSLNAGNNITIDNNGGDDVSINGAVTAVGNVTITSDDQILSSAPISGNNVSMTAGNNVVLGGSVTGATSITIDSDDDILNASIAGGLIAPTINLISGDDIGNVADRLLVDAVNLSLTAVDDIHVTDSNSVNLLASSAGDVFNVLATNNLTSTGAISGSVVTLRAQTGSLGLGANVTGTTSISLRSAASITNLNFTTLTTPTLAVTSDAGNIGTSAASRLTIDVDNLTANATAGSVFIFDTDSVNIGAGPSTASGTFDVVAATDLNNSGTISADNVSLRATTGNLTLNNLVTGNTSVTLRSGMSITDAAAVSVVASDQINLISDNGNIGDSGNFLNIDALNMTANAFNGSVFVNDANNINIGGGTSSAFAGFTVVAGSNLSNSSTITAQDVSLTATTGSLFLSALIVGGNSISLTQALTMTNANIATSLVSPQITLTSTTGSIGTGTFNRLNLDAGSITLNAANGQIFYADPNAVNIAGAVAAGTIDILAGNDLSTSAPITSATNLVMTTTGGDIILGADITGTTSVTLNAAGTVIQNAGSINGGALALEFNAGPVTLTTNVATLTTNAAGQTLTINEADGIVLNNQNLANLTVNGALTAAGNVVVAAPLTLTGDLSLSTATAGSDIVVNANITADDIIFNANGTVTQAGATLISGDELDIVWTTGDVTLTTNINELLAIGGGTTDLTVNELNNIVVEGATNIDNFTVNTTNGSIDVTIGIGANDITLNANGAASDVNLGSALLVATNSITLIADDTITQSAAGLMNTNNLSLTWSNGPVTVYTAVNNLTATGGANSLTVNENSGITLGTLNVGSLTVNAGLVAAGDITLAAAINLGGNLILDNNAGNIDLATFSVDALNVTLDATGTISQTAGDIDAVGLSLAFGAGPVTLATAVDTLTVNAAGQTLTINQTGDIVLGAITLTNLTVNAASDITTTVDITLDNLVLNASENVNLNSNVTGTTTAIITAGDTITQGVGFSVNGGALSLDWETLNVTLTTNVASLASDGNGNNLTINEADGIDILANTNLNTFTVNAGLLGSGDIDQSTIFIIAPTVVYNNAQGDIFINTDIVSTNSVSLTASSDIIQGGNGIFTPSLTVDAQDTITILQLLGNPVGGGTALTVLGTADATVSLFATETGVLTLNASTANSLTINAQQTANVVTAGDITVTNGLTINVNENFQNAFDLSADQINITSNGAGTFNYVGGALGGSLTAPNGINISSNGTGLIMSNQQNFFGAADLFVVPFEAITIAVGANIVGNNSVTLHTCTLNLLGTLVGNPVILDCGLGSGTIANSAGDVELVGDYVFNGQNFAIIASGDIITDGTTTTIDLSGALGGGTLTMLAGFDFTPATAGQQGPDGTLYTITGVSASGGSIDLTGVTINTSATGGNAGNVLAIASSNGVVGEGVVTLGPVNLFSLAGNGGTLDVQAEGGINLLGQVDSSSLLGTAGNVNLTVASSVVNGQVLVGDGDLFGTGSIDAGTATSGNINFDTINAGTGQVSLNGAVTAADSITQTGGTLFAGNLIINAGLGATTITSSVISNLDSTSSGTVAITGNVGALVITNIGGNQDLSVVNDGDLTLNSNATVNSISLSQTNATAALTVNGAVSATNNITLGSASTTAINVTNSLSSTAGDITITSTAGAVNVESMDANGLGGDIFVTAATDVTVAAGEVVSASDNVSYTATLGAIDIGAGTTTSANLANVSLNAGTDVIIGAASDITAGGDIIANAGNAITSSGVLNGTGNVSLTTTVGDITLNANATAGVSLTATANANVNVNASNLGAVGGDLTLTAAVGDISFDTTSTLNAGGDVILSSALTITSAAGVDLTVNSGDIVNIDNNLNIDGAVSLTGTNGVTVAGTIDGTTSVTINSGVGVFTTQGNITASAGDVSITTNELENTFAITGQNVNVQSQTGSGLVIDGTAGPGGSMTATAGVINITATDLNLDFFGEQSFFGTANLTVDAFQTIAINTGAVVTGDSIINLNTCSLILAGTLTAPVINFNCPLGAGTIANSTGDVDLSGVGSLVFNGLSLAIIASGDVLANGQTTIDLSNGLGDGGDLIVLAGFDFLPATPGQVNFTPQVFTITGASADGGDIDFTGLTINTSSSFAGGNGGSVTLLANGGGVNAGTITTDSITTDGDNNGGFVTIIGESNISTGAISTVGANGIGGNVNVAVAQPILAPGPSTLIGNGELLQGGFGIGAASAGDITISSISTGNAIVGLTGGFTAVDTIAVNSVSASDFFVTVADGSAVISNSAVDNLFVSGSTGTTGAVVLSNEAGDIQFEQADNALALTILSNGAINSTANAGAFTSLFLDGASIDINGALTTSGTATLTANTGNLVIDGSLTGAGDKLFLVAGPASVLDINGAVSGNNVALETQSGSAISIDAAVTATTNLDILLSNGGTVTQTAAVSATNLDIIVLNAVGTVTLLNAANDVDNLNVDVFGASNVAYLDADGLTLTVVGNAAQTLAVEAAGTLDLASAITADELSLVGGGTGFDIDQVINVTTAGVFEASTGDLTITATVTGGQLDFLTSGALGDINVNAAVSGTIVGLVTLPGTIGDINIAANITGSTSVDLVSDDGLTQTAGTIAGGDLSVDFNTGAAVLTTNVASLTSSVGANSLTVNEANAIVLHAQTAGTLIVNTTNGGISNDTAFSVNVLNLNAGGAGNDITLNNDVTGTTSVTLTAANNITLTGGAVINGGALSVNVGVLGVTTLATNVTSLTSNVPGALIINEANSITLLGGTINGLTVNTTAGSITTGAGFTANALALNAGGGGNIAILNNITANTNASITADNDIDISAALTANGSATLTATTGDVTIQPGGSVVGSGTKTLIADSATGNIFIGGALSGPTVALTTNGGNISQTAAGVITAPVSLTVNLLGGTPGNATLTAASNNVAVLNGTGGGTIALNNGANNLSLGTFSGTQSITASNTGAAGITFTANINTTGDINLTTNNLFNNGLSITAANIDVASNTGSGLNVTGGTTPNVAVYSAAGGVNFTATLDNLNLFGNITFATIADLYGLNGTDTIIVNTGADIIGQAQLTLHTCNVQLQGTIVGNPLVFDNPCGSGTIANSNGDVNLLGDIVYIGSNLAIIASGSINAAGATLIDLTNPAGTAGTLTMLAGFAFTPPTAGQVQDGVTTYTITGHSLTGGNINLGGVDIILEGGTGAGGNLVAIATAGSGAAGDITIDNISTDGATNAGNIQIIGEGDIFLANVSAQGGTAGGNITLATAIPSSGAGVTVNNGNVSGPAFTAGTNTAGSIDYLSLNAGTGDISLTGDLSVATAGTATGDNVNLVSSAAIGTLASRFQVSANTITGSAATNAFINNTGNTILGAFTVGAANVLDVFSTGNLGAVAHNVFDLVLGTDGVFNFTGVQTATNSLTLNAGTNLTNAQVAAANLATGLLILQSHNNADIGGVGVGNEFQVGAGVGEIRIDSDNNANVRSLATAGVDLGLSAADGNLTFLADGPLTVIDDVTTAEGDIRIVGNGGTFRVDDGVIINANSAAALGNIFLGNGINGGVDKKTTLLQIGNGAQILGLAAAKSGGQGGNVSIQLGALTTKNKPLNAPKNVTFNITGTGAITGGKSAKPFFAGKNGAPPNTINADNATVFISNTLKNKSISLEGNVVITADPPSAAGVDMTSQAYLPFATTTTATAGNNDNAGNNVMTVNNVDTTVNKVGNVTIADTVLNNAANFTSTLLGVAGTTNGAGVGGSATTATDTVGVGGGNGTREDNSYMVGGYGPTAEADASICSDSDLGLNNHGVGRTAHSNKVVLKKGNVLFVPFQDTVVETQHGNVIIEAKSVALVSVSDDKLAVYDFEDSHKGSVSVEAHGQKLALAPGSHVTLAHEKAGEFAQVNSIEAIPHRNVASKAIKQGVKAHTSEFSIASAIQTVKPLKAVMSSSHPQAKKVADKMVKTTAILLHMGGSGEFQHYFKPAMTAMAK